ncbi:hypothetical protein K504DRAFT_451898 [Pleomassaria siparia CBS 279.74]|uniref:Uncharacterized protein n=1 Tax=Pleomassaria siparia CBS 279.74 TaxID=1314801 RepID=A0A6G1JS54_9PLEO|nr:hypothetical protein K504DRAFT_451898 [Pleomassaria siparia CBS 279.74]
MASNSCPDAFTNVHPILQFAAACVFFVVTLCTLIAMAQVKKGHPNAKKLLGKTYLGSLLLTLFGYALFILAIVLRECDVNSHEDYFKWVTVFTILFSIAKWLLLVLVVYTLNEVLDQHHGHDRSYFKFHNRRYSKFIPGFILVIMGLLTCVFIGINCYYYSHRDSGDVGMKFALAYYFLYLVSVIAGFVLALVNLISMRSRGIPRGKLMFWTMALYSCMFIWVIFTVAEIASRLTHSDYYLYDNFYRASVWIENLFQALAWIFLIVIAKSTVFSGAVMNATIPEYTAMTSTYPPSDSQPTELPCAPVPLSQYQQQTHPILPQQQSGYTYHSGPPFPPQQQWHYPQQPVYNELPSNRPAAQLE